MAEGVRGRAEGDSIPTLRVQSATESFGSVLPAEIRTQLGPDDTASTLRSTGSSESSYPPSLSLAAVALDQGFMGTTRVAQGDEGFLSAYNMLTGIRTAVSSVCAKEHCKLDPRHYQETKEFSFDACPGDGRQGSRKGAFKFKDYAPHVFRDLRETAFRLDPADYLMSLTGKYIVSELTSPGKSGSFFYYSRDYRFIIKTIHHSEHRRLRHMLRNYHDHVSKNPNTLVSQFYGLHRVTLPFGRRIHFLVMNNVFPALYEVHDRYDLKGSTLGRTSKGSEKPYVVYKDLDWLADKRRIVLGPRKRAELIEQLKADVKFLVSCGVMDYSLLIGVHDLRKGNRNLDSMLQLRDLRPATSNCPSEDDYGNVNKRETQEFANFQDMLANTDKQSLEALNLADDFRSSFRFSRDRGGYQSTDEDDLPNPIIYYLGVIDFLTYYSTRKKLETKGKGVLHHKEKDGISAIPAPDYGKRFLNFVIDQTGLKPPANTKSNP